MVTSVSHRQRHLWAFCHIGDGVGQGEGFDNLELLS